MTVRYIAPPGAAPFAYKGAGLTLLFSCSSCRRLPALIGAERESFFFEIDFYIFELVENVLTQNAVDFSLKRAGELLRIHNQNALVFPNRRSDGQRCLSPPAISHESRSFSRRLGAREASGIQS
jgi:hypothetical protein